MKTMKEGLPNFEKGEQTNSQEIPDVYDVAQRKTEDVPNLKELEEKSKQNDAEELSALREKIKDSYDATGKRPFLEEGTSLQKIAKGGSVTVYDINNERANPGAESIGGEGKKVLKEYSQSQKNIEWLFGAGQNPSAQEQSKTLQKRQAFAQKYYDGLPDFVLKSQFLVADGSEGKPTVYEIQPKIEDYKPATLDNVESIIEGLTVEQRASLAKELTYFIKRSKDFATGRNFPEGYEELSGHIPDFQDGNVVVTSDGKLRMMDTNTYIDLNSRENQKDLFLSDIECFKTMLRKIKKSVNK